MADDSADRIEFSLSIAEQMAAVDRASWNALANPAREPYDPFLDWDFLEAAESSGCAQPETGWTPRHMLAHDAAGKLVGAPLFLEAFPIVFLQQRFQGRARRGGRRW